MYYFSVHWKDITNTSKNYAHISLFSRKNSYFEFDINCLKHFTSNAKELDTAEQLTNTHSHICFKNTEN